LNVLHLQGHTARPCCAVGSQNGRLQGADDEARKDNEVHARV